MNKLLFFLVLLSFPLMGQNSISGQVVSVSHSEPLVGVSVFINNTTIGTITGADGRFILKGVPLGKHELIVSIVGHDKQSLAVEIPGKNDGLIIKLKEKVHELEGIVVKAFDKNGWEKWGTLFIETFIGTTSNGERTKLKNRKDLRFRHNKEEGKLEVVAMKPLQIENNSLGYDLEYHLEIFEINFRNQTNLYAGYPFFKEPKKVSKARVKNREHTYNSSLMKFMRSLYNNTVQQDGYLVRKLVEKENLEKRRIQEIYKKYTIREVGTSSTTITIGGTSLPPEIYNDDSLSYFKKILAQPNKTSHLYPDTLATSSIVKTKVNQSRILHFEDFLYIVNTKTKEDKKYIEFSRQSRSPGPQTSVLVMLENEDIEIEENGNFNPPLNILSGEYWSWSNKIGDLLPLNYIPKSSTP
jgi:hypothetical protein